MKKSPCLIKSEEIIQSVKKRKPTTQDRVELAIELASHMLEEAKLIQTKPEKFQESQLAGMMNDPVGKFFTTAITDECFRSSHHLRSADQIIHIIKKLGVPRYLPADKRLALRTFSMSGKSVAQFLIPLVMKMIRKETATVILPGEADQLKKHMQKRHQEGVRVNLNHLGEAILGEEEAKKRLSIYLEDLAKPDVECISVKISTIYSQINLLDWDQTLDTLAERLRQLYRAAQKHLYTRPDGEKIQKFVNLDMEEYRDLNLTVALFQKVLDEPEFLNYEAGIVLQSYLPDSFLVQQELTQWAMGRAARGGAPIKIRIVKGANLAMEQVEASLRHWPQAPYTNKPDVDANYKRMVNYGCRKEHFKAVHLGIASHNLFDVAYALLLRSENGAEKEICFEMLEGMADHMRRVVQQLSGDMLLYCPAATKEEFQNAVAYLVRRLDENTAPDNFLRQAFDIKVGSESWKKQAHFFTQACLNCDQASSSPRRTQNRLKDSSKAKCVTFFNEPDTDWSLPQNRLWAEQIIENWKEKPIEPIPCVIGGKVYPPKKGHVGIGFDPSIPNKTLYEYALASTEQIDEALNCAKKAEKEWARTSVKKRADLLLDIAHELAEHRADLIGAMIADTGKTVSEADVEISEGIDFARYYALNLIEWNNLTDIKWKAKGTVLVTPPWNFPCSIPTGGITAALAAGNCVIFKPPVESVLVGWVLTQILWKAGVSREVLQFVTCEDDPVGSSLIKDPRVDAIILTGATSTAKLFLKMRPGLDLMAETGGKNAMVVTAMSDRDLAIKDLIQSAFGHAGQKCSACSLAILEAEVYDDHHFRKQLRDAAASLAVGSAWNPKTKVNPLIREPGEVLLHGLTQPDEGEEWLLEPRQDPNNPNLWSPGIKLGVKPDHFTFQNELFGPVLSLVRAATFKEALTMMNQTPYGLTAGIHSLDEREQKEWLDKIEAGNCYVNRTITGAIVERQPFGGCKESSFGKGAKAGGPNYLVQLMHPEQLTLPEHREEPSALVNNLIKRVHKGRLLSENEEELFRSSARSYAFYWNHYFSKEHDPSEVVGQDNLQKYVPHKKIVLVVQEGDTLVDVLREVAAALTCGTPLEISLGEPEMFKALLSLQLPSGVQLTYETWESLIRRLKEISRLRLLQKNHLDVVCQVNIGEVMANGRLELLQFLREVSISRDYHRYGNLGERENEPRKGAGL